MQRVGKDVFRSGLIEGWDGKCAVTGLAVPELLRTSRVLMSVTHRHVYFYVDAVSETVVIVAVRSAPRISGPKL